MPLRFRRALTAEGGGTRVDFRYEVESPGWRLRCFFPLLAFLGRRQLEGDYPKLLQLMTGEAGDPAR